MAQRFPTSGPSAAPPPGPMQPQQRYPGPAQPPGSPMPPRPYPGPNFPARSGFTPPPGGAGGAPPAGGRAAGGAAYGGGPAPAPLRPSPAPAPPAAAKRPGEARGPAPHKPGLYGAEGYAAGAGGAQAPKRKKRLADKILPQKVRDLVPESQAYMDLLAFERQGDNAVPSWELRVEGRLLDDTKNDPNKVKRKFSSFFKSLVIELDKELYGPDNHLVEWHRTLTTQETDGFQVKRPGYKNVRCTILLLLDYQPLQFKLDQRLARLLGVHTQTRPVIVNALWQYVKTHKLQDVHEREYVACDKYLEQIFGASRMKLAEVPGRWARLCTDPVVIHSHAVEPRARHSETLLDIDVEVDDTLKTQMNNFLLSTANQQEIQGLDSKIHETVDTINQLKTNREFFLSFSMDPQQFIQKWLVSQSRDLKSMGSAGAGGGEEERLGAYYSQAWAGEAVARYLTARLAARRRDLELALQHGTSHPHPHQHTPHLARL
ncbi:hypothetical protein SFRURICE_002308 [Spodoptera frugiperda]|nr:hypothetical protein SFRURICE_002308 [Spodoptera frugiperda]